MLNAVASDDALQAEVDRWVEKLASKSPIALAAQKDLINKFYSDEERIRTVSELKPEIASFPKVVRLAREILGLREQAK